MSVPSDDVDVVRHVHAARLSVQEEIDRAMVRVNLLDLRDAVHFLRDLPPRRRQGRRRDSGGHHTDDGEQITLRHDNRRRTERHALIHRRSFLYFLRGSSVGLIYVIAKGPIAAI